MNRFYFSLHLIAGLLNTVKKDAANEILRTEVLSRLEKNEPVTVVTYPDALAEKVVSPKILSDRTLKLTVGQHIDTDEITKTLSDYGFEHVDYVYEPGQLLHAVVSSTSILSLLNILTE